MPNMLAEAPSVSHTVTSSTPELKPYFYKNSQTAFDSWSCSVEKKQEMCTGGDNVEALNFRAQTLGIQ